MKFKDMKLDINNNMNYILYNELKKMKLIICILAVTLIFTLTLIAYLGFKMYVNGDPDGKIDSVNHLHITSDYMHYNLKNDVIRKNRRKGERAEERI